MTSSDWGHYSPGSDDAFPTPFKMEPIVVIVLSPFLTAAFVLFFETALDAAADFALALGLAVAFPKPNAMLASPLTITSMFPSALINRGATPPIKLITKPSTTVAFTKLVNLYITGAQHLTSVKPAHQHGLCQDLASPPVRKKLWIRNDKRTSVLESTTHTYPKL